MKLQINNTNIIINLHISCFVKCPIWFNLKFLLKIVLLLKTESFCLLVKSNFEVLARLLGLTRGEEFYEYLIENYVINREFKMGTLKRNHVCLLIDKKLHQIPWECLQMVEKQSIMRMPLMHCIKFIGKIKNKN